jgi:transcription elongation GreA/GreB family factor
MYMQCGDRAVKAEFILKHEPVANLDKVITFELEGTRMVRRLVVTVKQFGAEISIASPVGMKLANAKPGDPFTIPSKGTVTRPDPDGYSVGKVLSIADSVAQAAA